MPAARRLLASCVAIPSSAMMGQAEPNSSASFARKNPAPLITYSVFPKRPSTRSRKLARTESPTINAPPSTTVAVATPNSTARLVRQNQVRLRASKVEVRMAQLVSRREFRSQIAAVGHHNQDRLLPPVQVQEQIGDHAG